MEGHIPWIILSFLLFMNVGEGKLDEVTYVGWIKRVFGSTGVMDMSGQRYRRLITEFYFVFY